MPFERLPFLDPDLPYLSRRFHKTMARRTVIERLHKLMKFDYGDRPPPGGRDPRAGDPGLTAVSPEGERKGLSATQIYRDLCVLEHFDASYVIVRRLVSALRQREPEVYCRMCYEPGEEMQIDFGDVGYFLVDGRPRKTWLFVATLCYSRYAYYELVLDQTVPTFLSAIQRAFCYFGGAPRRTKGLGRPAVPQWPGHGRRAKPRSMA